ncbi:izumo sperm-egg fusion protein 2 [Sigmodon hispidus]
MPLAVAVALLCGLGSLGCWGCLQCDHSVLVALDQLREAIIPKRFHVEGLQARAQALLLGMEGPFFRDYAVNAFVGKVGVCLGAGGEAGSGGPRDPTPTPFWSAGLDQLENLATSFRNQTQYIKANSLIDGPLLEELVSLRENAIRELKKALKAYEVKACDHKSCHTLKEEVLDCLHCKKIIPKCIKEKYCYAKSKHMILSFQDSQQYINPGQLAPCFASDFTGWDLCLHCVREGGGPG